ncbi:MAG TPA: hypothetical protein VD905_06895 [Flavobacteriales bacterium]|nr:hypothetical protein [Flavobacteriales bacterium]
MYKFILTVSLCAVLGFTLAPQTDNPDQNTSTNGPRTYGAVGSTLSSRWTPVTVNAKIIEFVDSNKGKLVGGGECWDLAKAALDYSGAKWKAPYDFGKKISYASEKVLPGDIIHFKNVHFQFENGKGSYPEHTAIIYKVNKKGEWKLAQQNFNDQRFITIDDFNLAWKKSGVIEIYRPQ